MLSAFKTYDDINRIKHKMCCTDKILVVFSKGIFIISRSLTYRDDFRVSVLAIIFMNLFLLNIIAYFSIYILRRRQQRHSNDYSYINSTD